MKTIITILFATVIANSAFAEKIPLSGHAFYEVIDDTLLVISGQGRLENLVNKDLWHDYKDDLTTLIIEDGISEIGPYYFYHLPVLKRVTMANSVKKIGVSVFESCTALESVTLSESLVVINDRAFFECYSLKSIQFPHSVLEIGKWAFCLSGLTTMQLSPFLTEINESTFENCDLKSVELPPYVTKIGLGAFRANFNLKKVTLPPSLSLIDEQAFAGGFYIDTVIVLSTNVITNFLLPFSIDIDSVGKSKLFVPLTAATPFEDIFEWNYFFDIIRSGYVVFAYTDTDDNKTGGHVIQPEQRLYQPGEEVTFKAQPKEGYRFVNWTTYSAGGSKAEVVVSTDSVYTCTVGEDNIELTANFEKVTVGVEETEFSAAQFGFTLSPNPAKSTVNVAFTGSGTGTVLLSLYNISGVLVKTWDNVATPSVSLDVSGVNAGSYILVATLNSSYAYKQLVIQ